MFSDLRLQNDRILHLCSVSNDTVFDAGTRIEYNIFTDLRMPLKRNIRIDDRIASDLALCIDIGILGVDQCHAVFHVLFQNTFPQNL